MTDRGDRAATVESAFDRMLDDVVEGLSTSPKRLPSKYFYDEVGSELFDEITELKEYYLTRTETHIMERFASEMAAEIGQNALLVELGSGSSAKTRLLLERLKMPAGYVPVDISGEYLGRAADSLRWDHPGLAVLPVIADFTEPFEVPTPPTGPARRVAYFPGSTIGNFPAPEAERLLRRLRSVVGPTGGVLIGFDTVKSREVLEAAYDDVSGVTARFNLNVLAHINSVLGADFDLSGFFHSASFNVEASRIEMYLVSRRRQDVRLGEHVFEFSQDEPLLTEYSHKYTPESFAEMAGAAGLKPTRTWTDPQNLFCVQFLVPEGS